MPNCLARVLVAFILAGELVFEFAYQGLGTVTQGTLAARRSRRQ
jgi:hypothetical protein